MLELFYRITKNIELLVGCKSKNKRLRKIKIPSLGIMDDSRATTHRRLFNLLILMLCLPKATRARNNRSLYRLLFDTHTQKKKTVSFFQSCHLSHMVLQ